MSRPSPIEQKILEIKEKIQKILEVTRTQYHFDVSEVRKRSVLLDKALAYLTVEEINSDKFSDFLCEIFSNKENLLFINQFNTAQVFKKLNAENRDKILGKAAPELIETLTKSFATLIATTTEKDASATASLTQKPSQAINLRLKIAAQNGDFTALLSATKEELLSYRDEKGFSLLHIAACANKYNVVHFLIDDVGFDVDLTAGKSNATTLSLLFQINSPSGILLDFLIARGADFKKVNLQQLKKEKSNLLYSIIADAVSGNWRIFKAAAQNIRPLGEELALLPDGSIVSPIFLIGFIEESLARRNLSFSIGLILMREWREGCENLQINFRKDTKWQNLFEKAIKFGEPRFIQFLILNDEIGIDSKYLEKELSKNIKYFQEKKAHLIKMCTVFNLVRKIATGKAAPSSLTQEELLFYIVDIAQSASRKIISDLIQIYPDFANKDIKFVDTGVIKNVMQIFIEHDRGDALEIFWQKNPQCLATRIGQEALPVEFCCFSKTDIKYQALQFFARELKEVRFTQDGHSLVYFACISGPRALKILLQNEIFKKEIDVAQGQAKPPLYYVIHDILFGKEDIIFHLFETAKILIENDANIDFIFLAEYDFQAFSLEKDFLESLTESADTSPLRRKVIANLIDLVENKRAINLGAAAAESASASAKKKRKKKKATDDLGDIIERIRQISLAEELDRETLLQQIELAKQNGAINHLSELLLECVKAGKADALEIFCAQKEIPYDKKLLLQAVITSGSNNEKPCLLESEKIAIIRAMIDASQTKIIRKAINDCTWGPERQDKLNMISCAVHMNQPALLQFLIKECGIAIAGDSGILTIQTAALQSRKECLKIILDNVNFEEFILGNKLALRIFNYALRSFTILAEGDILYEINDDSIECAQIILDRCSDARQRRIITKDVAELAEIALAQQDGGKALEFLLKNGLNPNPEPPIENYVCHVVRNFRGINLLLLLIVYGADLDCQEVKKMVSDLSKEQPADQQEQIDIQQAAELAMYKKMVLEIITFCQTKQFDKEVGEAATKIIDIVIEHGNAAGFRRLFSGVEITQIQFINYITKALIFGNNDIARELLQRTKLLKTVINDKVRVYNPQNATETETTLLQIATSYQATEAVRILLQNEAQINICNSDGRTALSAACNIYNEEISRLVIAEAAKQKGLCNMPDGDGDYPLQIAVGSKNLAAVRALLEIEDIDVDLGAPIFSAIYLYYESKGDSEYLEIVNLLLKKGANINLISRDKKSPLYFAMASNNTDLVQEILNRISNKPALFEIKAAIEDPQIDIKILEILLNFGIPYQELFADGRLLFDARPDMQEKIALLQAHEKKDKAAAKIQAAFKDFLVKKELKRQQEELRQQENAATKIQATFRGFKARKNTALLKEEILKQKEEVLAQENKAAAKIQSIFRGYRARKQFAATKDAMQLEKQDRQIKEFLQTKSNIKSIADIPEFLQRRIVDLMREDDTLVLVKGGAIHKAKLTRPPRDLDLEIFIPNIKELTNEQIEQLIKEKLGLEVRASIYRVGNNFTVNFKCGLLDVSIYDSRFPPNEDYRWTSSFDAIRLQFNKESGMAETFVTKGCRERCNDIGERNPFDNFVINPHSRDRFLRACLLLTNGTAHEELIFAGFDKVVENANYWQTSCDIGRIKRLDSRNIINCQTMTIFEPDFIGKCVVDGVGVVATNATISILQKFKCLDNSCNPLRIANSETTNEIEKGLITFCEDHDLNGQLCIDFFANLRKLMTRYQEIDFQKLHSAITQQQETLIGLLKCAHKAVENCLEQSLRKAQENLRQDQNPQTEQTPSPSAANAQTNRKLQQVTIRQ